MYILNVNPYHVGLHVGYTPGDFHLSSTTYCRGAGRGGGYIAPQFLADRLTLFQPDYTHQFIPPSPPQEFQTFLRPSDIVTVWNKEKQVYVSKTLKMKIFPSSFQGNVYFIQPFAYRPK